MSRIRANQALEAFRDHGIHVVEWGNWKRRDSAGPWNPRGIMHHHTAGKRKILTDKSTQQAMVRILASGWGGLPGPLCHFAPAYRPWEKRAVLYAIGWGNANHAGLGDNRVLEQVLADTYSGLRGRRENTNGNDHFYGFEYLHPGDSTKWPDELIDVGIRAGAALCEAHGWKPNSNLEHFEWTDRKVDRSAARLGGRNIRNDVARYRRGLAREDDEFMALFDNKAQFRNQVRIAVQEELGDENNGVLSDRIADKVAARVDLDALADKVAARVGGGVDSDELVERIAAGLRERLAQ